MLAKPKTRILLGHAHKLILLAVPEAIRIWRAVFGPEIVEPVWVKHLWVLVVLRIVQDSQTGSLDKCPGWDPSPVFQCDGLLYISSERVYADEQTSISEVP